MIYLLGLAAVAALLAFGGPTALAGNHGKPGKPGPFMCSGGTALVPQDIMGSGGPYGDVTVTGICRFNGDVTINGDLTVADGAVLNNHASGVPFKIANVAINGDVKVGKGAVLGLGNYGPPGIKTNTVVNGDIEADHPLDLYLSGITVHGNVVSNGGGPGVSQFLNFPTKDDTIDGNLIVHGWQGGWIGAIRNTVGGDVVVSNNASVVHQTPLGCDDNDPNPANHCTGFAPGADPDSTEVQTNAISGNLICYGNTPAAQVNPSDGGQLNTVGDKAIGECAGLVAGKPGPFMCSGGTALVPQDIMGSGGPYGDVTVTGICRFNGDVTINGDLTVADGAVLNNHASGVPFKIANVAINGDVKVGKGAVLGLGNYGPPGIKTNTVVNGDIEADHPLDLYLSGITVHGNVVSNGGGPGVSQFLNFPTKDDTIDGNLIVHGWQGGWIGAIRNTVGGDVVVSNNASVVHQTPLGCDDNDPNPANHCTGFAPGADPDSTEVQTNAISGNLICYGNTPAAQVNPSDGGQLNTVGDKAIGECAGLIVPGQPGSDGQGNDEHGNQGDDEHSKQGNDEHGKQGNGKQGNGH